MIGMLHDSHHLRNGAWNEIEMEGGEEEEGEGGWKRRKRRRREI